MTFPFDFERINDTTLAKIDTAASHQCRVKKAQDSVAEAKQHLQDRVQSLPSQPQPTARASLTPFLLDLDHKLVQLDQAVVALESSLSLQSARNDVPTQAEAAAGVLPGFASGALDQCGSNVCEAP